LREITKRVDALFINTPHPNRYSVEIDGLDLTEYFHFTNRRNRPPLDLAYSASFLRSRVDGIHLALLEANATRMSPETVARKVSELRPRVVILNTASFDRWICPYPSLERPALLARYVREATPDAKIIIIGPHIEVFPEASMMEVSSSDLGVLGEPEGPVAEAVMSSLDGGDLLDIPGTVARDGKGLRLYGPARPRSNLDELPFPAYDLMPLDPYQRYGYFKSDLYSFPGRSAFILSSRGCPFSCGFCALYVHRRGFRSRSPESVVDEIELLVNKYGVGVIRFQDPEFSIDRKRTVRICEGILDRDIRIAWSAETRYDSMDRDLLELMRQSGCYQLNFGLESASQRVLDLIGKKQDVSYAEEIIRQTSQVGIHASNNLIFGLPGEGRESIAQTLDFARRLSKLPKVTFARASLSVPYPGTSLYSMGIEEGKFEPISSWKEFPRVLRASGQIGTEFRSLKEVKENLQRFNNEVRRIEWSSEFGSNPWLNPRFYLRMVSKRLRGFKGGF